MSKTKPIKQAVETTTETEESFDIPEVKSNALTDTGYALVEREGLYQVVKFKFRFEDIPNGQVLSEGATQFDMADELIIQLEEDIYQ